jgi:hypothetical protein
MSLNPGTVLDPTSIGKSGMWRVDGPGVLDVHGYIYYDGKALYVQSADDKSPLMVNKHRVSTAWTEVKAGSTIEVGRAELFYRAGASAADADATIARPMTGMPGQRDDGDPDSTNPKRPSNPTMMGPEGGPKAGTPLFRPGGGAFAHRADDESTRLRPMDEAPGGNVSQAPRPAAGAPMARPNVGRPMMDAQESTVIAPIEDLSGGRSPGGPRPGIGAMGGSPGVGMSAPGMGGPQMGMGAPGQGMGMPGGPSMGPRPGMPGQMGGGMPGQMGGMPGQPMGGMPGQPMGGMPGQMGGGMPGGGMPGQGMPGQPWGMPGGNPNATVPAQHAIAQSPLDKFKADWAGFPPGKRAIYIGCPFLMVAALIFLFSDSPADAGKTAPVPSSSSATANPAGGTAGANPMAGSTLGGGLQNGMQGATVPAGFQGGSLQPTATAAATTNIFGNPPPTPTASTSGAASGGAGSKPPPTSATAGDGGALEPGMGVETKNKTNERKAADAWAEGNYELAAQMYDELAREQPGNPAFPAAASILRQKLDAGVH